ncbi:hypothetical protein GCM10027160_54510 [Streptomyces calidiresistens]
MTAGGAAPLRLSAGVAFPLETSLHWRRNLWTRRRAAEAADGIEPGDRVTPLTVVGDRNVPFRAAVARREGGAPRNADCFPATVRRIPAQCSNSNKGRGDRVRCRDRTW